GAYFNDALAEAQRLGFAEADPSADVDGDDAAAKIAILAHLAFHAPFSLDEVYTQGIGEISAMDHKVAAAAGYIIKLLAIAEELDDSNGVVLRVDRKSTRLNSSHVSISYAVFCLKKKKDR